ncbi:MAG TPA: sigma-54 dependent transcriptional regulator [Polyangia bacterium]|jgi:two-component system response regulator HydG|nr:sigma-54 dependent transcriptional regulator [Polyangia bacterium]
MSTPTLLIVDDEASNLESLTRIFMREGLQVLTAPGGREALEILRKQRVDVLLTDLMMANTSGMDLLKAVRSLGCEAEVIVMTAYGTVESAVEAMKEGAYDFITKPLKRAHVVRVVGKALEKQSLLVENRALKAQLENVRRRPIVGGSLAMRRTLEMVTQAAPSAATVLLLGESGTGKEILARQIHDLSPRAGRPFMPVNCAAIPEGILEAELFGYERGAFTGAVTRRDGRFAQADGGTLFLDEIGEIAPAVQVKLLRVLQEGEIERLGGKSQKIDIRLVAATNKDLKRAVAEGHFREDLYYRLNVIAVTVPPLRDRRDDIPLLVDHFLGRFREKNRKEVLGCSRAALELLVEYDWPGNVRELENAVERAVVLTKAQIIDVDDLPREVRGPSGGAGGRTLSFEIGTPLEDIERRVIHETLKYTRGDKRLAAQLLGIATRTIYRKLDREGGGEAEGGSGLEADAGALEGDAGEVGAGTEEVLER